MAGLDLVARFEGHGGPVTSVCFIHDMKHIVSSSEDSTIRVWSLQEGSEVAKFQSHIGAVNEFAVTRDGLQMCSGGEDCSVCWWDVTKGALLRKLRYHNGAVNSVCYNDNASISIAGGFDSVVSVWDCRIPGNAPVQTMEESKDSITAVLASGYQIFSGSVDGGLRIYDIRQSHLTTDSLKCGIVAMQSSKDQQTTLISTLDSRILLYVNGTGDVIQTYKGHKCKEYVVRARFAADDGAVVSGSETGDIIIWELVSATIKETVKFGDAPIADVAAQSPFFSMAVASSDGGIGLFMRRENPKP